MTARITVHPIQATGRGRRVSARVAGRIQILGIAHQDSGLLEIMARAALPARPELLDAPDWVEWQGERPHQWAAGAR